MRLERMSWKDCEEYFKNHDMVILTTGSTENHGIHNPLGTDTMIPNKILELVEKQSDVLICPTLPYGDADFHTEYTGTISIGSDLLEMVMERISDRLYDCGARHFVFLNGHGGNSHALSKVCRHLYKKGAVGTIFDWWTIAGKINPKWAGGHGAGQETAAMLYVDESLVQKDKIEDSTLKVFTPSLTASNAQTVNFKGVDIPVPRSNRLSSDNGWFGKDYPKYATYEWGKEMVEATADFLVEYMKEFQKM